MSSMSNTRRSIRHHLLIGLAVVVLLVGGVGGWAATTEISGAVIASGRVVFESDVNKVQHPSGGIVGQILVRNGDHVEAGDVVVRLEPTISRANLAVVSKRLVEFNARKARLEAEREDQPDITFPQTLLAQASAPMSRASSRASASCSGCGLTHAEGSGRSSGSVLPSSNRRSRGSRLRPMPSPRRAS